MGIHGLWKLLDPAGKDITLESLEHKVLAIDVSLWLHQAQQGTNKGEGRNHANAHLLTLFHRISKLLFYRIKPVFVFDGVAPDLKKKTISIRKQRKQLVGERAEEMRQKLMHSLAKSGAMEMVLEKGRILKPLPETSATKRGNEEENDEIYKLPLPVEAVSSQPEQISGNNWGSDEEEQFVGYCEGAEGGGGKWRKLSQWMDQVDVEDKVFRSLPVEVRREILTDLKESRKESSWGRLHEMPKNLDGFSSFQMSRLLHRRKVQEVWEDVEKELATTEVRGASLGELEAILSEKGVDVDLGLGHHRIASDETKGYILLSGLSNQNTVSEAGKKTNCSLNLPETIKEEADESEALVVESTEKKPNKSDRLRESTLLDSNILTEKKVEDFIGMAIDDSSDVSSDAGKDFESHKVQWSDSQESLSQTEILEIIKGQTKSNSVCENSVETEAQSNRMKRKEVLGRSESACDGKDSKTMHEIGSKNKIRLEMEVNKEVEAMEEVASDKSVKHFRADAVIGVNSDLLKAGRAIEDEEKGMEWCSRIKESKKAASKMYLELGITGIIDEKRKNKDAKDKIREMRPFRDVTVTTSLQSKITKEVKDNIGKLQNVTENLVEMVVLEENKNLTQEEIMATIRNYSASTIEDKIEDHSTSGTSESDEFLEVSNATYKERTSKLERKDLSPEDSNKNAKGKVNMNLEVIIHPDMKPDDSTDIFADVFESCSPEESVKTFDCGWSLKEKTSANEYGPKNSSDNSSEATDVPQKTPEPYAHEQVRPLMQDAVEEMLTEEERYRMTLEMKKLEREANTGVTEQVQLESQELLHLFGVPWITAPFEAEAQCAFLEKATPCTSKFASSNSICKFLAEGTVTEDSDIWAFGASTVYRYVFDRRRTRVRLYTKDDICKKLGLSRVQVVQLALLTGSDYTIGLPGVGTVTALEILAAFPGEKLPNPGSSADIELDEVLGGLEHFADWWRRVEISETGMPSGHSYYDPVPAVAKALKRRLCACWKALQLKQPGASLLPQGFPSQAVAHAYLRPSVDECRDRFTWLKPDEAGLRSYAQLHFGWTKDKTDSILGPLFARLKFSDGKNRTQMSLHSFFSHIRTDSKPDDLECSNVGIRALKALKRIAGKYEDPSVSEGGSSKRSAEDQMEGSNKKSVAKETNKNRSALKYRFKSDRKQKLRDGNLPNVKNERLSKESGFSSSLYSNDRIPQREKDNTNVLQSKLKAIEVFRKTSIGRGKREGSNARKKVKRIEVQLSESSSD